MNKKKKDQSIRDHTLLSLRNTGQGDMLGACMEKPQGAKNRTFLRGTGGGSGTLTSCDTKGAPSVAVSKSTGYIHDKQHQA